MVYGIGKLNEDAASILDINKEYKDPSDFLDSYVRNLVKFVGNNIEFFRIIFNQDRTIVEPIMKDNISNFSNYLEKHVPNPEIDFLAFTITIFSFVYMYNLGVFLGPPDKSREDLLDKFIHNLIQFIN